MQMFMFFFFKKKLQIRETIQISLFTQNFFASGKKKKLKKKKKKKKKKNKKTKKKKKKKKNTYKNFTVKIYFQINIIYIKFNKYLYTYIHSPQISSNYYHQYL